MPCLNHSTLFNGFPEAVLQPFSIPPAELYLQTCCRLGMKVLFATRWSPPAGSLAKEQAGIQLCPTAGPSFFLLPSPWHNTLRLLTEELSMKFSNLWWKITLCSSPWIAQNTTWCHRSLFFWAWSSSLEKSLELSHNELPSACRRTSVRLSTGSSAFVCSLNYSLKCTILHCSKNQGLPS